MNLNPKSWDLVKLDENGVSEKNHNPRSEIVGEVTRKPHWKFKYISKKKQTHKDLIHCANTYPKNPKDLITVNRWQPLKFLFKNIWCPSWGPIKLTRSQVFSKFCHNHATKHQGNASLCKQNLFFCSSVAFIV